jgi:PAS domain S-box-containing protein
MVDNPIIANALIDSYGRNLYLEPFLRSHQWFADTEVQLLLSDFNGREFGNNGVGKFLPQDLEWLREQLATGADTAVIREDADGPVLIGVEMLRYSRTATPEGALLYKLKVADLQPGPQTPLRWGGLPADAPGQHLAVQAPPRFRPLGFSVHVDASAIESGIELRNVLWICGIATLLGIGFFILASRLANRMTKDLRYLENFSRSVSLEGMGNQRALPGRSTEVSSLVESTNRMLDKLHDQHAALQAEQEKFFLMANTIPQLAWMSDARGNVQWMNDRWHAYAGTSPLDPCASNAWHAIADPEMLPELQIRWKCALDKVCMDQFTVQLRGTDGNFRNFHTTIAPLRDRHGEVIHWVGTHTDVTEIARAKQEAEAAARVKSDFLATMSHEIRTHLNIVNLTAELARRASSESRMSELLGNILESSGRLLSIVETVPGLSSSTDEKEWAKPVEPLSGASMLSTGRPVKRPAHQATPQNNIGPAFSGSTLAPGAAPVSDFVPALKGIRVLLAEDNRFNQELAQEFLEAVGATVVIAENGREALLYLERSRFDCVLMDIQMPEMDGVEASRRIRENPEWDSLPIIAMTANAAAQQRLRCKEAGMSDFVSKPFSPDTLFKTILRHVDVSRLAASSPQKSGGKGAPPARYPELAGLDLNLLARIVGNDPEKIRRLVSRFVNTTEEAIAELNAGVEQKDLIQLAQLGHRYKSSAQAVGATELSGLFVALEELHEIEEMARMNDSGMDDQAAALMADVAAQFAVVRQAVAEWLDGADAATESMQENQLPKEWTVAANSVRKRSKAASS